MRYEGDVVLVGALLRLPADKTLLRHCESEASSSSLTTTSHKHGSEILFNTDLQVFTWIYKLLSLDLKFSIYMNLYGFKMRFTWICNEILDCEIRKSAIIR